MSSQTMMRSRGTMLNVTSGLSAPGTAVHAAGIAEQPSSSPQAPVGPSLDRSLPFREMERQLLKRQLDELPGIKREESALTTKKLVGSLTSAETRRLKYLRYRIDRFEDAEFGSQLDQRELRIAEIERLAEIAVDTLRRVEKAK